MQRLCLYPPNWLSPATPSSHPSTYFSASKKRRTLHTYLLCTSILKGLYDLFDSTLSFRSLCKQSHGDSPYHKRTASFLLHPCFRLLAKTSAACILRYTKFPTRIDKPYSIGRVKEKHIYFSNFVCISFPAKAIEPVNGHISIPDVFRSIYPSHVNCQLANLFSHLPRHLSLHCYRVSIQPKLPPRHWMDPCSCDYIRRSVYVS